MHHHEGRTLPFVGMSEAEGVALANGNVSRMSTVSADEAIHWDELHMGDHGKHTNMVESVFSLLRRMVQGQHHHVSTQYQYANYAAWLEDNGTLAQIVVSNAMEAPESRNWKGYWQRAA